MRITTEVKLKDINFKGITKHLIKYFTNDELDYLEKIIEEYLTDNEIESIENAISNFFINECDFIAQHFEFADFGELMKKRKIR